MFKQYYYNIILTLCTVVVGIAFGYIFNKDIFIQNSFASKNFDINKMYVQNFDFSIVPDKKIDIFLLNNKDISLQKVNEFSKLYEVTENMFEDDAKFVFSNRSSTLKIYKTQNKLEFENKIKTLNKTKIKASDVFQISTNFLQNFNIPYDELVISYDDINYEIKIIKKYNNYLDLGFISSLFIDSFGNISNFCYYFPNYKFFGNIRIKTPKDAYYELPNQNIYNKIILYDCQIVYIYENSILQPAYRFLGKSNAKTYEYFIKAHI